MPKKIAEIFQCEQCDGCGSVATDSKNTPWSHILQMRVIDVPEIVSGAITDIPCPQCHGACELRQPVTS